MNATSVPYVKMLAGNYFSEDHSEANSTYKKIIMEFLSREPEYLRLSNFRYAGWVTNKERGDAFFNAQRNTSDNADSRTKWHFYLMMIKIANQMHSSTNVFDIERNNNADIKILDIAMAPGGFVTAITDFLPMAKLFALTLSPKIGGHELILDPSKLDGLYYLDVTLLLKEYTDKPVPENHARKFGFLDIRPYSSNKFDLVICDGNVLRTHQRPEWREWNERNRLLYSQLILSMQRIRRGGTIIFLLHKIECWDSLQTIYTFRKFSKIFLFKPYTIHSKRSSFYMIAKNINTESSEAQKSLLDWRNAWWELNFGGQDGTGTNIYPEEEFVKSVLTEFGKEFIEMAKPIWKIQADSLSKTSFARP